MNDYVRQVILHKMDNEDDTRSDDEIERDEDRERAAQPTPHEELMAIKKRLAAHADSSSDEDSEEDVFVLRSKTETEKEAEEKEFASWEKVKKQNDQLKSSSGKALKSDDLLAHFWSVDQTDDPKEKFLRQYVDQPFLSKGCWFFFLPKGSGTLCPKVGLIVRRTIFLRMMRSSKRTKKIKRIWRNKTSSSRNTTSDLKSRMSPSLTLCHEHN